MSVLCYHTVDDDWASGLAVRRAAFELQMDWLVRHARVRDLHRAVEGFGRSWQPRDHEVGVTFDDGFIGVYDHAFPILRERFIPATVFIVTRTLTDAPRPVDWVREAHPDKGLAWMGEEQILEMREAGIRFGSHTVTHRDLPDLSFEEQLTELRQSRSVLEDLLRETVDTVAYPRGLHDAATREAAKRAGYSFAFGLPERREPLGRFAIPRVGVYRHNGPRTFAIKTRRPYLPLRLRLGTPEVRRFAQQVLPLGGGTTATPKSAPWTRSGGQPR
jgi:peptidoglycan/xylan/chitin deacetylase (PgdA/CDA1 family)